MIETRAKTKYTVTNLDQGRLQRMFKRKKQLNPASSKKKNTRSNPQKELPKLSDIPIIQVDTPPKKVIDVSRLRASSKLPTCSDFGPERESLFPAFYFCSPCTFWEVSNSCDPKGRGTNRNSLKNACTAKHQSWIIPTRRKKLEKPPPVVDTVDTAKMPAIITIKRRRVDNVASHTKKRRKLDSSNSVIDVDTNNITEVNNSTIIRNDNDVIENQEDNVNKVIELNKQLMELSQNNELLLEKNNSLQLKLHEVEQTQKETLGLKEMSSKEHIESLTSEIKELKELLEKSKNYTNQISENNNKWKTKLNSYVAVINEITEKEKNGRKLLDYYKSIAKLPKQGLFVTKSTTIADIISNFENNVKELKQKKNMNMFNLIDETTKLLFNENLFDGIYLKQMIQRCQEYIF